MFLIPTLVYLLTGCPYNCNECSDDENICTSCSNGYGLVMNESISTGQCAHCPEHCSDCSQDSAFCNECQDGYGPVLDEKGDKTGLCAKCAGLCQYCENDHTKCTSCFYRYSIGSSIGKVLDKKGKFNGECEICPPNCQECDDNHLNCTQCNEGFHVVYKTTNNITYGKCEHCPDDCTECDDEGKCIECSKGYPKDGKCVPCGNGCESCDNDGICESCISGYGLLDKNGNPSKDCLPCPANCLSCNDNHLICKRCSFKYGLVLDDNDEPTGQCENCPANCNTCYDNHLICDSCADQYGPVLDDSNNPTNQCASCPENCVYCSRDHSKCSQCADKYGPVLDDSNNPTGQCGSCPENCDYCYNNHLKCTRCKNGYSPMDDEATECVKCPSNCDKCSGNPAKCTICSSGYGLEYNSNEEPTGQCVKCGENCNACSTVGNICQECEDRYGIIIQNEKETKNCGPCPQNCARCSNDNKKCTKCDDDNFQLNNSLCVYIEHYCDDGYEWNGEECVPSKDTPKCQKESNGKCIRCISGYGLEVDENGDTTSDCAPCPKFCADCNQNNKACSLCKEGYGLVLDKNGKSTGQCQKCTDNCRACFQDHSKCTECDSSHGFVLNSNGEPTGECRPCQVGCDYCKYDYTTCTKCNNNYGFLHTNDHKTSICERCTEYCDKCGNNNQKCSSCSESFDRVRNGFELDENGDYTGRCIKCDESCDDCFYSSYCNDCSEGYMMVSNNGVKQCKKCLVENCKGCSGDASSCKSCLDGFFLETKNNIKICSKCPANCDECYSSTSCSKCGRGFALNRDTDQCSPCPSNCKDCSYLGSCEYCDDGYYNHNGNCIKCELENCDECRYGGSYCSECIRGFNLEYKDGKLKCVPCPENCDRCGEDTSFCEECKNGYGLIFNENTNTGKCGPCGDHCYWCEVANECLHCDDGYCYDFNPGSATYHQCLPCGGDSCKVDGCIACQPNSQDKCAICDASLQLDNYGKCVKKPDEIKQDTYEPVYVKNMDCNNGVCSIDFDKENDIKELEQLVLPPKNYDEKITEVTVSNAQSRNIAAEISDLLSDIKIINGQDKNLNIDLKFTDDSPRKTTIKLDPTILASITDGIGKVRIESTDKSKDITLNQVKPASDNFMIVPPSSSKLTIQEVVFNSKQALLIQSDDNKKVEINSLKVEQAAEGKLSSTTIKGNIRFGLSSFLEIDESVNLENSHIDIPFNSEHGQLVSNKAPIYGKIKSAPIDIVITDRGYGKPLASERLLIAQSTDDFCKDWKGVKITNKATNCKYNEYVCVNENNYFRLYAQEKDDNKSKNKLKPAEIAGIAVAAVVVVGVIIFLLVYFLVIKKKKKNDSSENEAGDGQNEEA